MRQNKRENSIGRDRLVVELERRLKYAGKNKINFFTPTMSPAPKDVENGEIESLSKGIDYYREYSSIIGNAVVLQKKYMGSYCAVYLRKNHDETIFVSRNGHTIRRDEETMLLLREKSKWIHEELFSKNANLEYAIVETELTPWSFMGSGLIQSEYGRYAEVYREKINYFKNNPSVLERINSLKEKYADTDKHTVPHHIKRQIEGVEKLTKIDALTEADLETYIEQVRIFGADGEVEFKPFNVLKTKNFNSKEEKKKMNVLVFMDKEDFVVIDLTKEDFLEKAREFQAKHSNSESEGIVIKPLLQGVLGLPPALKVRNKAYLQMIYGIDFISNFDEYLGKRNIKRKQFQSIEDYEAARMLLDIPNDQINTENKLFRHYFSLLVGGEQELKELDKRL